ncbi:hypothetical protein J0H58_21710 [bacterium]|nr:hypothetical protein [bacterium]
MNLDLSAILSQLCAGGNPYLVAGGALLVILYNRFLAKPPSPAPGPTPTPNPGPIPAPGPTGRPLLDALARILGGFLNKAPAPAPVPTQAPSPAPTPAVLAQLPAADLHGLFTAARTELAARAEAMRRTLADLGAPEAATPVK